MDALENLSLKTSHRCRGNGEDVFYIDQGHCRGWTQGFTREPGPAAGSLGAQADLVAMALQQGHALILCGPQRCLQLQAGKSNWLRTLKHRFFQPSLTGLLS